MKFFLTFSISAVLFFCFFYFYPAAIFESAIVDVNGTTTFIDLSIQSIFWERNFPEGLMVNNITSISPTTSGWLILIICNLGLPFMLAYRSAVDRSPRPKKKD